MDALVWTLGLAVVIALGVGVYALIYTYQGYVWIGLKWLKTGGIAAAVIALAVVLFFAGYLIGGILGGAAIIAAIAMCVWGVTRATALPRAYELDKKSADKDRDFRRIVWETRLFSLTQRWR